MIIQSMKYLRATLISLFFYAIPVNAGILIDLGRGGTLQVNDGIPKVVITNGEYMRVYYDPSAAKPLKNKPSGIAYGKAINSDQAKAELERLLFNGKVEKDTIYFDSPHSKVMYPRAMQQRYTNK